MRIIFASLIAVARLLMGLLIPGIRPDDLQENRGRVARWKAIALGVAVAGSLASAAAFESVPPMTGRVVDASSVLTVHEAAELERLLEAYEGETTHQIAVLIAPSLGGEAIEIYALRVAKTWALGRRGVDNGMLVVIAPKERRVRIELGRGFEGVISNDRAGAIIQHAMLPQLKQGRYAAALQDGLRELMKAGRDLAAPPASARSR